MKKTIVFFTIFVFVNSGGVLGKGPEETVAIKKAALDYMEGWYEGDAERMERALHPKLAKRNVFTDAATGRAALRELTAPMMIQYTRAGGGQDIPKDRRQIKVTILDVYKNTANVKATSVQYVDYLHLVKWDGEWVILNVAWEDK